MVKSTRNDKPRLARHLFIFLAWIHMVVAGSKNISGIAENIVLLTFCFSA